MLFALLLGLAVRLDAQMPPTVVIDVQCSGPLAPPRVILFTDGTAQIFNANGISELRRLPADETLFIRTMTELLSDRVTPGWLSYVPDELIEIVAVMPGTGRDARIPAYIRRHGVPATIAVSDDGTEVDLGAMYRTTPIENIVTELASALSCPDLFQTCR